MDALTALPLYSSPQLHTPHCRLVLSSKLPVSIDGEDFNDDLTVATGSATTTTDVTIQQGAGERDPSGTLLLDLLGEHEVTGSANKLGVGGGVSLICANFPPLLSFFTPGNIFVYPPSSSRATLAVARSTATAMGSDNNDNKPLMAPSNGPLPPARRLRKGFARHANIGAAVGGRGQR